MVADLDFRVLHECFLDPDIVALIETTFEKYSPDFIQSLEPAGVVRILIDTDKSDEARQLREKLEEEESMEKEQLPLFISAAVGWMEKKYFFGKNYGLVNMNEIAAICAECGSLVTRGFFDASMPAHEVVFRPEDCVYSNGQEFFSESINLRCSVCPSYNILTEKSADVAFLKTPLSEQSLEDRAKDIILAVAEQFHVDGGKAEDAILTGLSSRFPHLKTERKRKGKRRNVTVDYSAVYNIFNMIAHHYLDLEHIPIPKSYKPVLTGIIHGEYDSSFSIEPMLAMFKTRVKLFGRLSDKFLESALKLGDKERKPPHDKLGIRVVLPNEEMCYAFRDFVLANWENHPERSDDYIKKPKPNGYRALHEDIHLGALPIEVQIKTFKMDGRSYMLPEQRYVGYATTHMALVEEAAPVLRRVFHVLCNPAGHWGYETYLMELVGVFEEQSKKRSKEDVMKALALHYLIESFERVFNVTLDREKTRQPNERHKSVLDTYFVPLRVSDRWRELNPEAEEGQAALYIHQSMRGIEDMNRRYRIMAERRTSFTSELATYLTRLGMLGPEIDYALDYVHKRLNELFTRSLVPDSKKPIYMYEVVS